MERKQAEEYMSQHDKNAADARLQAEQMLAAMQSGALSQQQIDELLAGRESVLDKQDADSLD